MDFKSLIPFGRTTDVSRRGEDPFTSLRREMDRLFDSFTADWSLPTFTSSGFLSPKVNVVETETGLEVTAELPGIDAKDIQLDLTDNVLTLKAEHGTEKEEKDEKKHYHVVERSHGTFLRRFALPFEADADKVEAAFDKGVLKVTIPKAPASEKPVKKIEIKAA